MSRIAVVNKRLTFLLLAVILSYFIVVRRKHHDVVGSLEGILTNSLGDNMLPSHGEEKAWSSVAQCGESWKPNGLVRPGALDRYFTPEGYTFNPVKYFSDLTHMSVIWQPDVYNYAAHLASAIADSWIIDVGGGTGLKAARIYNQSKHKFVELDFGKNLAINKNNFMKTERYIRSNGTDVLHFEWDISKNRFPDIGPEKLRGSTIVSADVIEHLENPDGLVDSLLALFNGCNAENLLISTINRRSGPKDPPQNPHHVREWSTDELEHYLTSRGAAVTECTLTYSNNREKLMIPNKRTILCFVSKSWKSIPDLNAIQDYFPYTQ